MDPIIRTTPRPYQSRVIQESWELPHYAIFHEQGLGKTKVAIDTACKLAHAGKIDQVLIMSRKSVVQNWELEELPKHHSEIVPYRVLSWQGLGTTTNAKYKKLLQAIGHSTKLTWLCMNIEAINMEWGQKAATAFLKSGQTLFIIDESTLIKTPSSKRTKRCVRSLGPMAAYRRILSGEPAPNGVQDLYSQYQFLSPDILRVQTNQAFIAMFTTGITQYFNGRGVYKPTGIQNQEELEARIAPFTSRLKKNDVLKELPEKQYIVRKFKLPDKIQRAYDELRDEYRALIEQEQTEETQITALHIMPRLIRLHQMASGYTVDDDTGDIVRFAENAKLDALSELVEEIGDQKIIIWAKYRQNIKDIQERLGVKRCAVIWGSQTDDIRAQQLELFRSSNGAQFLLAIPQAAGWGLTLTEASNAIYYTNDYNWEYRIQSEDRIHRIGQTASSVNYYDLIASGTVDEHITDILKTKAKFSEQLMHKYREIFCATSSTTPSQKTAQPTP